jgi:hypothetical protein
MSNPLPDPVDEQQEVSAPASVGKTADDGSLRQERTSALQSSDVNDRRSCYLPGAESPRVDEPHQSYRDALKLARANLVEAEARLNSARAERDALYTRIRQLRAVIYALAQQLGEDPGLVRGTEEKLWRGSQQRSAGRRG